MSIVTIGPPHPAVHDQLSGEDVDRRKHHFDPENRKGDATAFRAAIICISIFVLASWMPIIINGLTRFGWFTPHPLFQSAALALLTYGVLTLQPTTQPSTKAAGLSRHQFATITTGVPLILAGAFFVWYNKELGRKQHFTTWHGTLGFLCTIWLVSQVLVGGGSVWFGGVAFGGGVKAKRLWKYHRASGYLLFSSMLLTAHLGGAWSDWTNAYTSSTIRLLAFTIAPFVVVASVLARVRLSKMIFF
ncbi:hypothetical protein AX15_002918 [Amanita polypyramis BW_CC]|nr:hypothetical protein AX15_002918 [Amanita polypyramis BW_CC]